ncbi:acyltransferase family protein [Staphylococcus hyicus]|uniref:acyltransferase family protein n=1 Tax=Staphylococcus hyicus TaxID=1284 RepID=UPI00057D9D49|nr:acyltransferase family protein [Staphylococcus hyicus]AJC96558.1 acyltransferase [Staphylococcus hyicus]RTX69132.1 acyltransferase family protein [Staphylococcus hyicus]SQE48261.1 putative acyltransferase [Staphylococcus hyicus]
MAHVIKRDAFFDNARALLIFLVVFGHLIQPYTDAHPAVNALYLTIYSFHMPAFLFISGYFSKNVGRVGYLEKVGKKLLGPYLIFFTFFSIYYFISGKNSSIDLDPFDPVFALWFLLTLFCFNVIIVIVKNYKWTYVLPIAILIAVLAGFSSNIDGYLSWSRTLVFFPIFYIGYILGENFSKIIRWKKLVPLSFFTLFTFFIVYYIHPIDSSWLLGSSPYANTSGWNVLLSPLKRLTLYLIIFTTLFAFLNLVPQQRQKWTYIGSRTMYVYLLHGLFIGIIRGHHLFPFIDHPLAGMIYNFILSIFIVWLWSTNVVAKWTNPFVHLQKPSQFKPYS